MRSSFVFCLFLGVTMIYAGDWTQWRGPDRNGQVSGWVFPEKTPDQLKELWQVSVGSGYAAPVVSDQWVFLHTRVADEELVSCYLRKNGKLVWQQKYPAPFLVNPLAEEHGAGPKSTPILSDGKLLTMGIGGILSCFQASTGKLLWRTQYFEAPKLSTDAFICAPCGSPCCEETFKKGGDCPTCGMKLLPENADTSSMFYGIENSPLVLEGKVITQAGNDRRGAVTAHDLATGALKWAAPDPGPGYASPVIMTFAGTRQVVTFTRKAMIGLSLDGKPLWSWNFPDITNHNNVTPIQVGDMLVVAEPTHPLQALRVFSEGGNWELDLVWENYDLKMDRTSPVLIDGKIFGLAARMDGQFFTADAKTGKTLWTSEGQQGQFASMFASGTHLIALNESGQMTVFNIQGDAVQKLGHYKVSEKSTGAHIVPDQKSCFFIKDQETLRLMSF